jgi:serine/threonine protein kinase/tetratricopeptide (TPR) repeat protein
MIGRVLHGTIELKRLIGRGGMGAVYEGYQAHLERRVAVKIMTPEHAQNPMAAEYFIREAKQSSAIRHPNIIQIFDFGKEGDVLFLAMEFVPGVPLSSIMREEALSPERITRILDQMLAALEEAHENQIVHRDLKPDNIMIEQKRDGSDFVKILDFGIAQSRATPAGPLTLAGAMVGTPHYMSPEQAEGKTLDGRSDLFSVGVILYELLAGELPFTGNSLPQILISVIQREPAPPRRDGKPVDPALEAICLRAMAKNPDLRYQNASEFRQALKTIGTRSAQEPQAPAAQFIFKRARSAKAGIDDTIQLSAPHTPAPPVQTQPRALAGLEESDSEVVDTSRLFETVRGVHPQPETPQPVAKTRAGLDLDALKQDLLGERFTVATLIIHQRFQKRLDPEELADTLQTVESRLMDVVKKRGGLLQSRQGAFTTIFFGAEAYDPQAGAKACQCALELRSQLKRHLPDALQFAYGISSGEVFVPKGEWSRATGEVVEDATELSRSGHEDEIRVGSQQSQLLDSYFKFGPEKNGARSLVGIAEIQQDARERTANLIGRDGEIASLLSMLASTSRGQGKVLVVLGQAGIGKSAVLNEACVFAEQRAYLVVRCLNRFEGFESLRHAMYQWIVGMSRAYGRGRDIDIFCRELGVKPEFTRIIHAFTQNRLSDVTRGMSDQILDDGASSFIALNLAFKALLDAVCVQKPLLLVVDDLDGLNASFVEWLPRFQDFVATQKVALALGVRSTVAETPKLSDETLILELERLDDSAARALLKTEIPVDVSAPLRAELVRLAAGVPGHLHEVARIIREQKVTTIDQAQELLARVSDIKGALMSRVSQQDKPAQNLLALLAVLGNDTPGEVLLDLASEEWKPEHCLEQLYRQGVLNVEGDEDFPTVRFQPPVLASVIVDQMSRKMRARVHERAADYFLRRIRTEAQKDRRRLWMRMSAQHLVEVERFSDALTLQKDLLHEALIGHEYEVALEVLARLQTIAPRAGDDPFQFQLTQVRVLEALGRTKEATLLARNIDRADDVPESVAIQCRVELGQLWLKEEDPELVEKLLRKTLQDARRLAHASPNIQNNAILVRVLQTLAHALEKAGKLAPSSEMLLEAIEITERHALPATTAWGPRLLWEPLNQLGRIRLRLKELTGAASLFELALKSAQDSQDLRGEMQVRANLSVLWAEQNRLDAAVRTAQQAVKIARSLNDLQAEARLRHNEGLLALRQKRSDLAADAFEDSLRISQEIDFREGIAMNTMRLQGLRPSEKSEFLKPRGY